MEEGLEEEELEEGDEEEENGLDEGVKVKAMVDEWCERVVDRRLMIGTVWRSKTIAIVFGFWVSDRNNWKKKNISLLGNNNNPNLFIAAPDSFTQRN